MRKTYFSIRYVFVPKKHLPLIKQQKINVLCHLKSGIDFVVVYFYTIIFFMYWIRFNNNNYI